VHDDVWSRWLLSERHGDDIEYQKLVRQAITGAADRVLDAVHLQPGMLLADIGSGDGLVAFRAIERLDGAIRVILTDISESLLRHAATAAGNRGIAAQCRFMACSAERLDGIEDASLDALVARASIAYVADKKAAFSEFYRTLKKGGRLSIAEPILQDEAFAARALRETVQRRPEGSSDRFLPLLHRWKSAQFPDTEDAYKDNALVNFSERDLINYARSAGFAEVHLQLHIDVAPSLSRSWEVFVNSSPHPWAPSLKTIFEHQFTAEERQLFEQVFRPTVESGRHFAVERAAYLSAIKD
jgi:arsenite methyltransferase